MKSIILAIVTLASVSSYGSIAPKGEHAVLVCVSEVQGREFSISVVKNTRSKAIKMVLEAEGQEDRVYTKVKEEVSPRVGGPTRYSALAPGGHIFLEINFTSAPLRTGGRAAVLVSTALGRSTTTQLHCAQIP